MTEHPMKETVQVTRESLEKRYPEAYKLMCGFYCDTAYYNSAPECRPADNVLMAIQYTLDRARLSATSAPAGVEGWKLVPVEPTEAMYDVGYDATRLADGTPQFSDAGFCLGHAGVIYRAMIAAAPAPSGQDETCITDEEINAALAHGFGEQIADEISGQNVTGKVKWRERWYGSEPEKGSAITDERGNLVAYFGGDEATHAAVTKIVTQHNAAVAASPAPSGQEVAGESLAQRQAREVMNPKSSGLAVTQHGQSYNATTPPASGVTVPEGMKAWDGGESAPEDWAGPGSRTIGRLGQDLNPGAGPIYWRWATDDDRSDPDLDIIAYTPKDGSGEGRGPANMASATVERIATAVMTWGRPHFRHMVAFSTLCEAIEKVLPAPAPSCAPGEVERVAQAIHCVRFEDNGDPFDDDRDMARAAIAALSPQGLTANSMDVVEGVAAMLAPRTIDYNPLNAFVTTNMPRWIVDGLTDGNETWEETDEGMQERAEKAARAVIDAIRQDMCDTSPQGLDAKEGGE